MAIGPAGFASAAILLREGVEVILVIAALSAFLRKMGGQAHQRALFTGALVGVAASFAAAWALELFFEGSHNDLVEASIMVVAAGLMFYMSGWLLMRQDPAAWQSGLRRATERAVGEQAVLPIAAIAFLAVFREGGETVLFLHALAQSSGGWTFAFVSGLLVAGFVLGILFACIQLLSLRLPLRPFFAVTSAFLFLMGLKQVGDAIWELQEQTIVSLHDQHVPALVSALGANPSWEALGTQAAILAAALFGFAVLKLRRRARASAGARLVAAE